LGGKPLARTFRGEWVGQIQKSSKESWRYTLLLLPLLLLLLPLMLPFALSQGSGHLLIALFLRLFRESIKSEAAIQH
jgi:hypothetical protein